MPDLNKLRRDLTRTASCLFTDLSGAKLCSGWPAFFIAGTIVAVLAAQVASSPSDLVLITLAIGAFTLSAASLLARGMTLVSFFTFTIGIYVIFTRLGSISGSGGYFAGVALAISLTTVVLAERFVLFRPVRGPLLVLAAEGFAIVLGFGLFIL